MFKNNIITNKVDAKKWFKGAGIRAIKTFAQTAVSLLPISAIITDVDWKIVIGTALLAAVSSLLTSIAGIPEASMKEGE